MPQTVALDPDCTTDFLVTVLITIMMICIVHRRAPRNGPEWERECVDDDSIRVAQSEKITSGLWSSMIEDYKGYL